MSINFSCDKFHFPQKTRQEAKAYDDICLAVFVAKQAMCGKLSFLFTETSCSIASLNIALYPGFSTVVSGTGKTGFSTGISVKSHIKTSRASRVYPRKF